MCRGLIFWCFVQALEDRVAWAKGAVLVIFPGTDEGELNLMNALARDNAYKTVRCTWSKSTTTRAMTQARTVYYVRNSMVVHTA